MNVSRVQQEQIKRYNLEQIRQQEHRDEDYRKVIEKRRLDLIAAERIARARRLGLDKGQNVDIEC
jgi:hypothetical protein